MKLNEKSLTPLYQQVLEDIKAGIASGTYQPGGKIPSEAELSQMYDVSRVTVRRAIEELVGEGYLTSRQGKGTFVNQRAVSRKLCQHGQTKSFRDLCASAGMTASVRLLDRRVVPARPYEEYFGPACEQLIYLSRVYLADGVPIVEEDSYLPYAGYEFLLHEELDNVSLFELLAERTGQLPQKRVSSTVEMTLASARMAKVLEVTPGEPLFHESVQLEDQTGKPLCLSDLYLVGSRYSFEV